EAGEKAELEDLFKNLGLTLTQAVQTFFAKSLLVGGLPYEVRQPKFNQETLNAMQEALDIKAGKIQAKRYDSVEEMFADE
ncbi:MAG: type II toxin-antitoxin system RelB/DinJ family antitoxin, partial [Synergistaceae bacterium]|nr:type II toxin-antitoxin system RelB/DinJ family antitoxin [Synergistaceae bacterium]